MKTRDRFSSLFTAPALAAAVRAGARLSSLTALFLVVVVIIGREVRAL